MDGNIDNETVSSYFDQAATLRLCLQYNKDDYAFAKSGGRIIYLFDANVVHFFIYPEEELAHIAAFGKSHQGGYAPGTALITAEFLFSRGLAGQEDSPALITPAHADEILGLVDDIREIMSDERVADSSQAPMPPGKAAQLRDLVERISAGRRGEFVVDRASAATELTRLVPEVAAQVLKGSYHRLKQLQRLYDDDLLRPLALHTEMTADVLSVPQAQVALWMGRIQRERSEHAKRLASARPTEHHTSHRERGRRSSSDSDQIRRDAESVIQVMLLDASAPADRVAYVLVTADHRLFDAYAKWYWEVADPKERGRFILRQPLQYAPILNVTEMPNGIEDSDVITRATRALDALFANLNRLDGGYPHKLSFYRTQVRHVEPSYREPVTNYFQSDPLKFGKNEIEQFEKIRRDWHESFRTGVLLNAELMQRRVRAVFGPLAKLLRDDGDLRHALHEDQRRALERIERAHLYFSTRLNLSLMARDGKHAGARTARAPLLVRSLSPTESLQVTLDRIAEIDSANLELLYRQLAQGTDFKGFLIAACISFRCEQWDAAILYAKRALDLLNSNSFQPFDWTEVAFVIALSTRYSIGSASQNGGRIGGAIKQARQLLEESARICEERGDAFGLLRTKVETDALELMIDFRDRLIERVQDQEVGHSNLSRCVATAQFAAKVYQFDTNKVYQLDAANDAWKTLMCQSWSNVISVSIYNEILMRRKEVEREAHLYRSELESAVESLAPELSSGRLPPIMVAEHLMARLLCGHLSAEQAAVELEQLIPRSTTSSISLELDRAEIELFRTLLSDPTRLSRTIVLRYILRHVNAP